MIEYDQTPDVQFYLCRQCRAHMALTQDYVITDIMIEAGIFRNAVNVHVEDDPTRYRMDGHRTVANVYCERCRTVLGWKFVEVPDETILVKPGRFLLYLNKLLLWDGSQILEADNRDPVENATSGSGEDSNNDT
ncbi:hypothetical protein Acr_00g0054760 [Actinidia rufa]|uniref:Protein yippee-like n=1 Tax=Actinidia rufa TaxID=165716 RepID=A0A7J0DLZ0_9ERIC|nr:hypothetical protein Acr_00g0054760 [Actinidia rufa]